MGLTAYPCGTTRHFPVVAAAGGSALKVARTLQTALEAVGVLKSVLSREGAAQTEIQAAGGVVLKAVRDLADFPEVGLDAALIEGLAQEMRPRQVGGRMVPGTGVDSLLMLAWPLMEAQSRFPPQAEVLPPDVAPAAAGAAAAERLREIAASGFSVHPMFRPGRGIESVITWGRGVMLKDWGTGRVQPVRFSEGRDFVTVGSGPEAGIQLGGRRVREQHARLLFRGGAYRVMPYAGVGPTRLNGDELLAGRPAIVGDGDLLELGARQLLTLLPDPPVLETYREPITASSSVPDLLGTLAEADEGEYAMAQGFFYGPAGRRARPVRYHDLTDLGGVSETVARLLATLDRIIQAEPDKPFVLPQGEVYRRFLDLRHRWITMEDLTEEDAVGELTRVVRGVREADGPEELMDFLSETLLAGIDPVVAAIRAAFTGTGDYKKLRRRIPDDLGIGPKVDELYAAAQEAD